MIKLKSFAFFMSAAVLSTHALADPSTDFLPSPPPGKEWKLVWHDEFDGAKLDESKWNRLGDWKRRDGFWIKGDAFLNGHGQLTEEIGKWGGDISAAQLPDTFEVDYVRVYDLVEQP